MWRCVKVNDELICYRDWCKTRLCRKALGEVKRSVALDDAVVLSPR